jgi:hypothetical protein
MIKDLPVISDDDSANWSEFGNEKTEESESPGKDETNEIKKDIKKENTGVWVFKFLVLLSIVIAATLVSGGAYYMLRLEETDAFETSVRTHKHKRSIFSDTAPAQPCSSL